MYRNVKRCNSNTINVFAPSVFPRELLLRKNRLYDLPYSMGKLFKLQELTLDNNPLAPEISQIFFDLNGTHNLINYLLNCNTGEYKLGVQVALGKRGVTVEASRK